MWASHVQAPIRRSISERRLEVVAGQLALARRFGDDAQEPVRRPVAGDAVPDGHDPACVRRELGVELGGERVVAHEPACVREVGQAASQSPARSSAMPRLRTRASSRRASSTIPSSASIAARPGAHDPPA